MIPLLFQNRFIIGYLKINSQLIIIVDLQINQCKVSINLLAFSLLTKVQSQLKVRTFRLSTVKSIKVKSQLIVVRANTFNQSKGLIIGKNSINHLIITKSF